MAKSRSSNGKRTTSPMMVRLDDVSKDLITRAAELRRISVSDYVRQEMVSLARKELDAAANNVLTLSPEEQLTFWNALNEPITLTRAQIQLGQMMRGES